MLCSLNQINCKLTCLKKYHNKSKKGYVNVIIILLYQKVLKRNWTGLKKHGNNICCKYWLFDCTFEFSLINKVIFEKLALKTLKVQSCKLNNNKYMIGSTQQINNEIFVFIAALVFKLLNRKVLFINIKHNRNG